MSDCALGAAPAALLFHRQAYVVFLRSQIESRELEITRAKLKLLQEQLEALRKEPEENRRARE